MEGCEASSHAPALEEVEGGVGDKDTVRVVLQRCDQARLLVDNVDTWVEIGKGLILYISFQKGATTAKALKAARTILQLPLLTDGQWGDGTSPHSVLDQCAKGVSCPILVVPQASLTCKVKGKILNYRGQLDKDLSRALYHQFVAALSSCTAEALSCLPPPNPKARARKPEMAPQDPEMFFRNGDFAGKYSAFDQRGVPTHQANGEEVSKSHAKKLERLYLQQVEKCEKYTARGRPTPKCETPTSHGGCSTGYDTDRSSIPEVKSQGALPTSSASEDVPDVRSMALPEGCVLPHVVSGTFGNRQALHLAAECGPFTHLLIF